MYLRSLEPALLLSNSVILDSPAYTAEIAFTTFLQSLQYGFVSVLCVVLYEWVAKYVPFDVFSTSLQTTEQVHSLPDEIRLVRRVMFLIDCLRSSSRGGHRYIPVVGQP